MDTLHNEVAAYWRLRDQLLALYPDIDERTLADSLEGATDLNECLIAAVRSIHEDEALAEALKDLMTLHAARLGRLTQRVEAKRGLVAAAMEEAAVKKLVAPDFTLSLTRVQPKVIVTDESQIPQDYIVVPEPQPRIDRKALKEALQGGEYVPGATLSNGSNTITVRRG